MDDSQRQQRLIELLAQWDDACNSGRTVSVAELCRDDPGLISELEARIARRKRLAAPLDATTDDPAAAAPDAQSAETEVPATIGPYRVNGVLGEGGYGTVYLGYDDELERAVAIKVPRADRVTTPDRVEAYLTEARLVAKLDHPAIVKVFFCGRTPAGLPFVVSPLIEGSDLAGVIARNRPTPDYAAEITATIAEALAFAHQKRVVHRDVKPSNVLVDKQGRAFLADFGLALQEQDFGRGSGFAGTPRYMSPEQARGEGHRVDGRSDIYSLGVMFYEMLTGQVPFPAKDLSSLLQQIETREPPPPRQLADGIAPELERICLKALAKRASDRYITAADLAEDIRRWQGRSGSLSSMAEYLPGTGSPATAPTPTPVVTRGSDPPPAPVLPKGLAAYDAKDADFYLELLPGPRDRDGLPPGVRFWKSKIEERDPDETFPVGVMYGPSGCGKSSLVRAGLIPRLDRSVQPVYVEAGSGNTEARLLRAIRKQVFDHADIADPPSAVAFLRRRPAGPKVVLVLDQFEQWLFNHPDIDREPLTAALRQCDGGRVQALLLVRDDFITPASRLLKAIEVPLREGVNSAMVDLFDPPHARKVLQAFGRAYATIGERPTPEQERFIADSVDQLQEGSRVVAVRLGLFAQMVKGKPWVPATLTALGGAGGVGEAFLEESLGASAPASRRSLIGPATRVLAELLPPPGSMIKGTPCSVDDLRNRANVDASTWPEVVRLLDSELRLITPAASDDGPIGYQLTHDYLVPSIRSWLDRRNRATRRGRARLLLEERANQWAAKPARRNLPSVLEWARIRLLTKSRDWSAGQRAMMRRAGLQYAAAAGLLAFVAAVAGHQILASRAEFIEFRNAVQLGTLYKQGLAADPTLLGSIVRELRKAGDRAQQLLSRSDVEPEYRANHEFMSADWAKLAEYATDPTKAAYQLSALMVLSDEPRFWSEAEPLLAIPPSLLARLSELASHKSDATMTMLRNVAARPGDSRKRAHAAALLWKFGEPEPAMPLLAANASDLDARTHLTMALAALRVDPKSVFEKWQISPAARYSLTLTLGEFDERSLPPDRREAWVDPILAEWQKTPDAGVRAATEWLLGVRWAKSERLANAGPSQPVAQANWIRDKQAGTMTIIRGPVEFTMGPAVGESSKKSQVEHRRRIARSYAIAAREVTAAEYKAIFKDYSPDKKVAPTGDCPASATWIKAALYCNELSRRAGLPESEFCFEKTDEGIRIAPNYLGRIGYRLPTEAEWEFACRAGSTTSRCFGNDSQFLDRFAWVLERRLFPVGQRMPNPWGMFDLYGNAREWCMEPFGEAGATPYKGAVNGGPILVDGMIADEIRSQVISGQMMSIRSHPYYDHPEEHFSANRFRAEANNNGVELGFRVTRTIREQ